MRVKKIVILKALWGSDLVVVIQILGRKVLDVSFGSRTVFLARNPEMGGKRHKIVRITLK